MNIDTSYDVLSEDSTPSDLSHTGNIYNVDTAVNDDTIDTIVNNNTNNPNSDPKAQ